MADFLIRGMEIPGTGEYHMTLYVCSEGSAYIDVASFPVDEDRFEAAPVPAHGRLIDADELLNLVEEKFVDGLVFHIVKRMIQDAPTVLTANTEVVCK